MLEIHRTHKDCSQINLLEYLKSKMPTDEAKKEYKRRTEIAINASESDNYCAVCDVWEDDGYLDDIHVSYPYSEKDKKYVKEILAATRPSQG